MRKIIKAPLNFKSQDEARNFVLSCEWDFEKRLNDTITKMEKLSALRFITLSGPTCSGKTTAAKKIISEFAKIGRGVNVISIDDFYYDKDILHKKSALKGDFEIDYDSADTIDIDELERFIGQIEHAEKLLCPIFDFNRGCRTGYRKIVCGKNDVFIFEGIQALYPEITSLLDKYGYCSVHISPQSSIELGGEIISPNELRLLRRLVRDRNFRSTSAEFTFKIWDSVRANEEKNIFPYADACTFYIDSTFAYEINILKPFLLKTLGEIEKGSLYAGKANAILDRIYEAEDISTALLPKDSLYFEFVY
jgi:uridine kinase